MVVDASVALKWQLNDEEHVSQAIFLRNDFYIRGVFKVIAPQLLLYEMVNGIAVAVRRRRLDAETAVTALGNLLALGVELRAVAPMTVLGLALRYGLASYDAAYLALAESEGCDLWTADWTFYNAVKDKSSRIRWIGEYPLNFVAPT